MNAIKKSVGIILALLMLVSVFSIMPITAHAEDSDWEYGYDDYNAWIDGYKGTSSSITIPKTIAGHTVTIIGSGLGNNPILTSVTIPEGVEIGINCFRGCTNLSHVNIPDDIVNIGSGAFYNTAIYNDESNYENGALYIGHHLISVKQSYSGAFVAKKGTVTLADGAFEGCENITSIKLPYGNKHFGRNVFDGCDNLEFIEFGEGLTRIENAISDTLTLPCKKVIVPSTVTDINCDLTYDGKVDIIYNRLSYESLFYYLPSGLEVANIDYPALVNIYTHHFMDDNSAYFGNTPDGCYRVCFEWNGEFRAPNSQVIESGEKAKKPETIPFRNSFDPDNPVKLYANYGDCDWYTDRACTNPYDFDTPVTKDITLYGKEKGNTNHIKKQGYERYDDFTKWEYDFDTYTFTIEVSHSSYDGFFDMDGDYEDLIWETKHLVVEDGITAIDDGMMLNSEEIETVKIAGSVKSIGADCFQCCEKLRSVTLGEGIETIGNGAFSEIPLVSEIKIPDSVKTISDGAFLSNSDNFKLIGKAGSAAQTYAEANGIKFEAIEETEPQPTTSPVTTDPQATTEPQTTTEPVETIAPATTEPQTTTEPVETTAPATTEPQTTTEPAETTAPATTEPQTTTEPVETTAPVTTEPQATTAPAVTAKKPNPVKVTVKTKTVKLKNLKKKNQTVKAITVKNAKGIVTYKLVSVSKKIKKLTKISSKGVITIKKWAKAKKGTYKFKVKITAAGNADYKKKSVTKTVTVKIK